MGSQEGRQRPLASCVWKHGCAAWWPGRAHESLRSALFVDRVFLSAVGRARSASTLRSGQRACEYRSRSRALPRPVGKISASRLCRCVGMWDSVSSFASISARRHLHSDCTASMEHIKIGWCPNVGFLLCHLRVLCASVVSLAYDHLTTEAQRAQRSTEHQSIRNYQNREPAPPSDSSSICRVAHAFRLHLHFRPASQSYSPRSES